MSGGWWNKSNIRWPPMSLSFAASAVAPKHPRAAVDGVFGGPEHTRESNDGVAPIVMIEIPEGIANAAGVEGVDTVFIGPNDLAHSMDHNNRWSDAPIQHAILKAWVPFQQLAKAPAYLP